MASQGESSTLADVIDRLAAEFHEADRVLVEAAVRVAHLRLGHHAHAHNWMGTVERLARTRLHTFAAW